MRSPNWFILKATGSKQGDFKIEKAKAKERGLDKDSIPLHALDYSVQSPFDVVSGHTSGKRVHRPFTMFKTPGASSPQWWNALVTNETITVLNVERWEMRDAKMVNTIKFGLTDCQVVDWLIQTLEEPSTKEGAATEYLLETIKVTFRKIQMDWVPGSTTGMDDWLANA